MSMPDDDIAKALHDVMKVFDPMNSGFIYRDAFLASLGVYELGKPSSDFNLTKLPALTYLKNKIEV